jgi:hypothetical protein
MTTNKSLAKVAVGLAIAAGLAACNNDNLTSLNQNPNNPTNAPAGALFTNAVNTTTARFLGAGYDMRGASLIIQHQAETQYSDEDRYQRLQSADTRTFFDSPYSAELEDLKKVAAKGLANGQPGVYGPALTMQTWTFSYLTDSFGDVPYSDALSGDSTGGALLPKYDAQKDIYAGFFKTLSKVSADLATDPASDPGLGSADPIYNGDVASWQKFANSLHARYALRLVNVDPATADAQLKAAFTAPGGVFTSNSDMALMPWPGDGTTNNPWSNFYKGRDDNRMSQTLMNRLLANNDPRVKIYAQPVQDSSLYPGGYGGMPNGLLTVNAGAYGNTASRAGAIFFPGVTSYGTFGGNGAKLPSYIMTYAEVALIQAEAAERGLGGLSPSQAAGFYNAGVTASLKQWGITDATAIANYLGQPSVAYKGGVAGLKQIALQKYIALYTDGGQAWAEWRRTCIPAGLTPGPGAIVSEIPRRFFYSPTEVSVNGANLQAAIARQGADNFLTRVYWDTKPTAAPTCS